MSDLVPRESRIDRATLERVIKRAAELQAREKEIGDNLTESELMQLGEDVGIPSVHLRRALMEERSHAILDRERGRLVWLAGPRRLVAERTIKKGKDSVETGLQSWLAEGELLQVKRRHPNHTTWEAKEGAFASLRRSLGLGGRRYLLARAREISARVTAIDDSSCHVELVADLTNTWNEHLWGSALLFGGGAATTGLAVLLGVVVPIALVPIAAAVPISVLAARSRRGQLDKFQVALEQVLDRLEHGELDPKPRSLGPGSDTVSRIAHEIRKSFGSSSVESRRKPGD